MECICHTLPNYRIIAYQLWSRLWSNKEAQSSFIPGLLALGSRLLPLEPGSLPIFALHLHCHPPPTCASLSFPPPRAPVPPPYPCLSLLLLCLFPSFSALCFQGQAPKLENDAIAVCGSCTLRPEVLLKPQLPMKVIAELRHNFKMQPSLRLVV